MDDHELFRILTESEQVVWRDQLRRAHAEARELFKDVQVHPDIVAAKAKQLYNEKVNAMRNELSSTITRDTDHSDQ